jgi:flagellar motor protein MotB
MSMLDQIGKEKRRITEHSNDTPQGRSQNRRVELSVPASGC